jgi:hypothetical protein
MKPKQPPGPPMTLGNMIWAFAQKAVGHVLHIEFFDRANEFRDGYKRLPVIGRPPEWAKYLLFYHAIELALKAYLIQQGISDPDGDSVSSGAAAPGQSGEFFKPQHFPALQRRGL